MPTHHLQHPIRVPPKSSSHSSCRHTSSIRSRSRFPPNLTHFHILAHQLQHEIHFAFLSYWGSHYHASAPVPTCDTIRSLQIHILHHAGAPATAHLIRVSLQLTFFMPAHQLHQIHVSLQIKSIFIILADQLLLEKQFAFPSNLNFPSSNSCWRTSSPVPQFQNELQFAFPPTHLHANAPAPAPNSRCPKIRFSFFMPARQRASTRYTSRALRGQEDLGRRFLDGIQSEGL